MKKFAIMIFLGLIVLSSCKKNLDVDKQDTTLNLNTVNIPNDFNWKTTHEVQVIVTGFVNGLVEVASPNGATYQRAFIQQHKPYSMKITLPAYEKKIHLLYMGQNIEIQTGTENVNYTFLKP